MTNPQWEENQNNQEVKDNLNFFDNLNLSLGENRDNVYKSALKLGINFRKIGNTRIGITLDERTRPEIIEAVWRAFGIDKKDDDLHRSQKKLEIKSSNIKLFFLI